MFKISAIICTYRRSDYLRRALESLREQTLPAEDFEVVVVDNAVEPEVQKLVNDFQSQIGNLCYVEEHAVGLSRARNTGFRKARSPFVAFLDDDARADSNWLAATLEAFEQSPAPAAVGGRVWLDWHGDRPAWIPDNMLSLYTHLDLGESGHELRPNEYLVGANLAFEKAELENIGGFDRNLGRQGAVLLSGEEARALEKLKSLGRAVYYEPSAIVWHSVDSSRRKPSWLLRRLFWDGASQPLLDQSRSRRAILRGAWLDLRQCFGWSATTVAATVSGKRNNAWKSLLELSQRAGRVRTQLKMLAAHPD